MLERPAGVARITARGTRSAPCELLSSLHGRTAVHHRSRHLPTRATAARASSCFAVPSRPAALSRSVLHRRNNLMSGLGADLFVPLQFSQHAPSHGVLANASAAAIGSLAASSHVDPTTGATFITIPAVGLSAVLVIINMLTSMYLKLGLEGQLLIATIRCIVQLSILGYILVPIFTYNVWWLVLIYAFFMIFIGALEAVGRPVTTYKGMLAHVMISLSASSYMFIFYGLIVVVHQKPWWDAQYFIPIMGMLLGNTISGISIGLATILEECSTGRDRVEQLLCMGANRWEAMNEVLRRSVRLALTPLLNQMNVVGLVSIPGMMTGQILGGTNPAQAARYQMVIMFLISATCCLSSLGAIFFCVNHVVDLKHRLRADRLIQRDRKAPGFVGKRVNGASAKVKKWWREHPPAYEHTLTPGEGKAKAKAGVTGPDNGDLSAPLLDPASTPSSSDSPTNGGATALAAAANPTLGVTTTENTGMASVGDVESQMRAGEGGSKAADKKET